MMALYNATNGDSWFNNTGWKTPPLAADGFALPGTECGWAGVTCTGDVVTQLDMSSNLLSGNIPPELGGLSNMTILDLADNLLTGGIPSELGGLSNLESLDLGDNQLNGIVPPALGSLVNLEVLRLRNNQLNGSIPPELGDLSSLISLYLDNNQFSGSIPPELGSLSTLVGLYLGGNQLSGSIPSELGNLSSLAYLYMNNNQLDGSIPPVLGSLPNLFALSLYNNRLNGSIPSESGNLSALYILSLSGNQLVGPIPSELSTLSNLSDGGCDLRWNALFTTDDALRTFLNSKQNGGDWESTQTIAPTGLTVTDVTYDSVTLSWAPVAYQSDPGGYVLEYGLSSGVFTTTETIADKTANTFTVTGLVEGVDYYFHIGTYTDPHASNQNTVYSDYSDELQAQTPCKYRYGRRRPAGQLGTADHRRGPW